jgi:hypothetical protein
MQRAATITSTEERGAQPTVIHTEPQCKANRRMTDRCAGRGCTESSATAQSAARQWSPTRDRPARARCVRTTAQKIAERPVEFNPAQAKRQGDGSNPCPAASQQQGEPETAPARDGDGKEFQSQSGQQGNPDGKSEPVAHDDGLVGRHVTQLRQTARPRTGTGSRCVRPREATLA